MQIPRGMPAQRRLKILGEEEIEAMYGLPRFTPDERGQYFALSHPEKEVLQDLRLLAPVDWNNGNVPDAIVSGATSVYIEQQTAMQSVISQEPLS